MTMNGDIPEQQSTTVPAQPTYPANTATYPAGGVPEGFIEKARFDGLVRKVEELTLTSRGLDAQLVAKSSELEQLKSQLSLKDTEKNVAVGEREGKLTTLVQENSTLKNELDGLRALQLKIKVIQEIGNPDLLGVIDSIPSMTDPEAMKTTLQALSQFADKAVQRREEQLRAGWTPPVAAGSVASGPASAEAWTDKINSLPLGSSERQRAFDDYYDFLAKSNSRS